jgi:hypothetical protein
LQHRLRRRQNLIWDKSASSNPEIFEVHPTQEFIVGFSDPEIQKKVFGPRWQHEVERQSWPLWKRLLHRLQRCPICKPKADTPDRKTQ